MAEFPFEALESADLVVGAVYRGGEGHTVENEPLHRLLGVGNVGGFRRSGPWEEPHFVVLYSSFENPHLRCKCEQPRCFRLNHSH